MIHGQIHPRNDNMDLMFLGDLISDFRSIGIQIHSASICLITCSYLHTTNNRVMKDDQDSVYCDFLDVSHQPTYGVVGLITFIRIISIIFAIKVLSL